MSKLKFLKALIFPRVLQKLQNWVNYTISLYLKFFSDFIINGITIISCEIGHNAITYVRKLRLLLDWNLTKETIKENIVKKIVKKYS